MSLILSIDTSGDLGSISLAESANPIQSVVNREQKDHASWIHPAISKLLSDTGFQISNLQAIAVTIGPGSYTGLRIGLATAKGLCYVQNLPLIAIGTLELMAYASRNELCDLICPMIDARRMEVFTSLYNKQLEQLMPPQALILNENSFTDFLRQYRVLFMGNGSVKFCHIASNPNALFSNIQANATDLAELANNHFVNSQFVDLAYSEPLYIKNFHSLHTV